MDVYNLDMIISVGYESCSPDAHDCGEQPEEKDVIIKVVVNLINRKN